MHSTGTPEIVISVPHSGSRSLCRHLGLNPSPRNLWHFGSHDHLIRGFKGVCAIPVRNPYDILESWIVRQKNPIEAVLLMDQMAGYDNPKAVFTVVERLEQKVGHREVPRDGNIRARAIQVFNEYTSERVKEFYSGRYTL
jgi:hypothetical protein